MVQTVKNLPAMQETQVRFLGQEDPLEKGVATHSSILAWEISWTEEPSELQSVALQSQTLLNDYQFQFIYKLSTLPHSNPDPTFDHMLLLSYQNSPCTDHSP